MMQRCYQSTSGSYNRYGELGITVSEEWHDLNNFIETIDQVDGFDLDKIVNGELQIDKDIKYEGNKVYSKGNCTFVSPSENSGFRPSGIRPFIAIHLKNNIRKRVVNREKFCRENDLHPFDVWKMCHKNAGKGNKAANFYKGWQFFYEEDFSENKIKLKKIIKGISPNGEEHIFSNIRKFSTSHNLNENLVHAVLKGRQHTTRGWTFEVIREANY